MADSLIYLDHLRGNVRITFLLLDLLNTIVVSDLEQEVTMQEAVAMALKESGQEVTDQKVATVIHRLSERQSKDVERAEYDEMQAQAKAKSKRKHWGENLNDWALNRDAMEVCMYVADFDAAETRRLYCEEDTEFIFTLAKAKFARDFEFARAGLEAAVYGAGGSFKGGDDDAYDLVNGGEAAEAELAAFFGKGGL